ncbi:hypothetical protein ACWCOW_02735 [Streptomyces sp. NPDC001939]|uniref:hypothetical protein n=1 Tax=unclassified Streptomyces TaxID=2593676 RepID=UPI00332746D0
MATGSDAGTAEHADSANSEVKPDHAALFDRPAEAADEVIVMPHEITPLAAAG